MSKVTADSLSVQVIEQIMDRMSVKDRFVALGVSKKWESAARRKIQQQKRLVLRVEGDCFEDTDSPPSDPDEIRESYCQAVFSGVQVCGFKNLCQPTGMWKSLLQMERLEILVVDRGKHANSLTAVPIVLKNCATLRHLSLPCFSKLRNVSFPALCSLVCDHLYDGDVESAPSLQSLTCADVSRDVLSRLPVRLTSLTATCAGYPAPSINKILMIKRFPFLETLSLTLPFVMLPEDFFSSFQQLVSVTLHFVVSRRESEELPLMDAVLINMVQHNVGLREVDLRGVHVSDQWLHHLSQAPVIRYVSLTHCLASSITTDGVIHLLRGRSRNNLRLVRLVTSDSLSAQTIRQEIDLMHQENDSSVEVVLTPATNKLQQMGITTRVSVFL